MAGAGLLGGAAAQPVQTLYLWPCNVPAWNAWNAVQTQWRTGMSGATGLDYAGVRAWLELAGPETPDERRDVFNGIRACESATLAVWAAQRAET